MKVRMAPSFSDNHHLVAVQQPTKPFLIAHGVRQGVLHVIDTRISYHGIERCHPRKEGAANRLLKALEALQVGVVLGRCRLVRGRFSPKQLNERPRRDRASLNLRPLNAPEPFTPRRPPALPGCRRGAHQPLRCPLPPLRGHPPFRFSLAQASPKTWAATLPLKVAQPPWRWRKIDDRRPGAGSQSFCYWWTVPCGFQGRKRCLAAGVPRGGSPIHKQPH